MRPRRGVAAGGIGETPGHHRSPGSRAANSRKNLGYRRVSVRNRRPGRPRSLLYPSPTMIHHLRAHSTPSDSASTNATCAAASRMRSRGWGRCRRRREGRPAAAAGAVAATLASGGGHRQMRLTPTWRRRADAPVVPSATAARGRCFRRRHRDDRRAARALPHCRPAGHGERHQRGGARGPGIRAELAGAASERERRLTALGATPRPRGWAVPARKGSTSAARSGSSSAHSLPRGRPRSRAWRWAGGSRAGTPIAREDDPALGRHQARRHPPGERVHLQGDPVWPAAARGGAVRVWREARRGRVAGGFVGVRATQAAGGADPIAPGQLPHAGGPAAVTPSCARTRLRRRHVPRRAVLLLGVDPVGRVLRQQPLGEVQALLSLAQLLPQPSDLLLEVLQPCGGLGTSAGGAAWPGCWRS